MVREILTDAGFVENETFTETMFIKPPKISYAVYMDSFERRGADTKNMIREHSVVIEHYSYKPDPNSEANIERELDLRNLEFNKEERTWIQSEQLYQTVYSFDYIEK